MLPPANNQPPNTTKRLSDKKASSAREEFRFPLPKAPEPNACKPRAKKRVYPDEPGQQSFFPVSARISPFFTLPENEQFLFPGRVQSDLVRKSLFLERVVSELAERIIQLDVAEGSFKKIQLALELSYPLSGAFLKEKSNLVHDGERMMLYLTKLNGKKHVFAFYGLKGLDKSYEKESNMVNLPASRPSEMEPQQINLPFAHDAALSRRRSALKRIENHNQRLAMSFLPNDAQGAERTRTRDSKLREIDRLASMPRNLAPLKHLQAGECKRLLSISEGIMKERYPRINKFAFKISSAFHEARHAVSGYGYMSVSSLNPAESELYHLATSYIMSLSKAILSSCNGVNFVTETNKLKTWLQAEKEALAQMTFDFNFAYKINYVAY